MFRGPFRIVFPRHPLARLLAGVIGAVAVLLLVALSMFALAALAIGGGVLLLVNAFRTAQTPAAAGAAAGARAPPPPGVIEGEFSVIDAPARDRDSAR
jgi:hypothetical protein